MNILRDAVYNDRPDTVEEAIELMENVIIKKLTALDEESSRLVDKYDETEFVHYYAGKTMAIRDVSSELGINFSPKGSKIASKAL